jgi:hypothetical protein
MSDTQMSCAHFGELRWKPYAAFNGCLKAGSLPFRALWISSLLIQNFLLKLLRVLLYHENMSLYTITK